jgi:hypothetical protein
VGAAVEIGDWGRNGAAATILAAGAGVLTGCKGNIIISIIVSTLDIFMYVTPDRQLPVRNILEGLR